MSVKFLSTEIRSEARRLNWFMENIRAWKSKSILDYATIPLSWCLIIVAPNGSYVVKGKEEIRKIIRVSLNDHIGRKINPGLARQIFIDF